MFSTRLITAAVVTALFGIVLAGQAAAGIRPDDRAGLLGTGFAIPAPYPDVVGRAVANHKARVLRPDDRSGRRGSELSLGQAPRSTFGPASDEAFDWADAGIGASTVTALLLLTACGLGLVRRTTRKRRAVGAVV
jgi:hypothetical protein